MNQINAVACPHAESALLSGDLAELLTREWLISNNLGGYASSTVINCNTRRYHGLLVPATIPPVGRIMAINNVLERLIIDGREFQISSFEFNGAVHPDGFQYQTSFHRQVEEDLQSVTAVFQVDGVTIIRTLWLFADHNTALIYWLAVDSQGARPLRFFVHPLVSLRDFHSLRRRSAANVFDTRQASQSLHIRVPVLGEKSRKAHHLYLHPTGLRGPVEASFHAMPDWWYNFRYRVEAERGQDCGEDLFMPGHYELAGRGRVGFGLWLDTHGLDFQQLDKLLTKVNAHLQSGQNQFTLVDEVTSPLVPPATSTADNPLGEPVEVTLRKAARQFVVRRDDLAGKPGWSILAGFHWFGDWGRDTFIALPGLLLETGRYEQAAGVLRVFGSAQSPDGLIPNRFDDYGGEPHYNSVDASLWYVYAADCYLRATNDVELWNGLLEKVCIKVVESFLAGSSFDTKADPDDMLLWAGNENTQITWMDARFGSIVFTPRWGKPVEINALWYNALRILAERLNQSNPEQAARYAQLADRARESFRETFWNRDGQYLFDCVRGDYRDPAIRPNQIFAVSLRESPLRPDQQLAVVECCRRHLLTPFGLRSLAPGDPSYHGFYAGDPFQRDSAYHQGTVWAWLIGPFVEAYLKTNDYSYGAASTVRDMIKPLLDHLYQAGVGSVSEIFDGDAPHTPRGCIAQAWSVAQLIQAQLLINQCLENQAPSARRNARRTTT
ncbi:MAG: hypothetical protein GXY33_03945 [Phycisphaerae bacterium]|nr:hypothetical protein [Phycisphaerae bacterium]